MIMQASGVDRTVENVDGQRVFLKRGQFLSSERELATRWSWSKGKIHRFIKSLKVGREVDRPISVKVDRRYSQKMGQPKSIITITNYDKYNPLKNEDGPAKKIKSGPAEKIENGPESGPLLKERYKQQPSHISNKTLRTSVEREGVDVRGRGHLNLSKDHLNFLRRVEPKGKNN